jgi:uncharacterized membrane protein
VFRDGSGNVDPCTLATVVNDRPKTMRPSRTARGWLWLTAGLAAVFCAGILLAPCLETHGARIGSLLRLAYHPACHQQGERCLDLGFGLLAVCARCTGLYVGGLIGLVWTAAARPVPRPRPRWLLIAIVVNLIDVAAGIVGLSGLPNWPRFAIALPIGLLCGLFLAVGIVDTVDRSRLGPPKPAESPPDPVQ